MEKEDYIKQLILQNGYNMKNFAEYIDVPYTTFLGMFTRGFENSSIQNVIKVCKGLSITVEELINTDLNQRTSNLTPPLNTKEKYLLDQFNQLNDEGQERATNYTEDLVNGGRYKKFDVTNMVEKA